MPHRTTGSQKCAGPTSFQDSGIHRAGSPGIHGKQPHESHTGLWTRTRRFPHSWVCTSALFLRAQAGWLLAPAVWGMNHCMKVLPLSLCLFRELEQVSQRRSCLLMGPTCSEEGGQRTPLSLLHAVWAREGQPPPPSGAIPAEAPMWCQCPRWGNTQERADTVRGMNTSVVQAGRTQMVSSL